VARPLAFSGLTIPAVGSINAAAGSRMLPAVGWRTLIPLTYGEDRVRGQVLNIARHATDTSHMLVQVLWGHACHAVDTLRLNDQALPAGATVSTYTGSQVVANADLVAAFAVQGVTYGDVLGGFAYSVVAMPISAFDGRLDYSARVFGRKLYDPRLDSTAGGSGPHRLNDATTWEWSENPSLALADWLQSSLYGAAEPVSWSSVPAAANANAAAIGSPAEVHRKIGLTLYEPTATRDMAEALRAYAGCWLVPAAGGVKLLPDTDAAASAGYDHAAGQIAALEPLQLRDLGTSPTAVEVIYTDTSQIPWRAQSVTQMLPGAGTTLPWRVSTVRLPGIHRVTQAYREATERLNKLTLSNLSTSVEVFDVGIAHEKGDIITLTHPVGLAAKPFRVTDVHMPTPGRWRLAIAEHDPAAYSTAVVTTPTYADTSLVLDGFGQAQRSLIDATWWRPGAAWEWALNEDVSGENSIVWGAGPRGESQALWQAVAAGTPGVSQDGGWTESTLAATPKNAFAVDVRKTYRFALPVRRVSGAGPLYWGPSQLGKVCTLNTSTPDLNPYASVADMPLPNRWYLIVFFVYPAGSTGLTNASAGVYDMETGERVLGANNFCWAAGTNECSTRAYQYYNSTGATTLWAQPQVQVLDGYEAARISYIGQGQVGYPNLAPDVATDLSDALSTAAAAQATADGKIDSYWQTTAPGSASEGDLWFDTDDGNKQYRWTSGAWVAADDTRIGTAISAASTAQATADGKVVTFVQTSAPTAEAVGDLWLDSDDGFRMYRWSGSAWLDVRDAGISAALSTAAAAQATADGKIDSYWQASAPGSASEGDLWFDTDDGNKQYRWTSGAWVAADDTRIGTAISAASTAQATADGKVVTFVQASAPTAEGVGDIWIESDNGNKLYRWSGSSWDAFTLGQAAISTAGVATGNLADHSVTSGAIEDSSTVVGSSGSPGASVRVATVWGPTITTEAGDELDINVAGLLEESFWSQAALAYVELWLTHAPTFGGTQTEFGTRRRYLSPVDVYTANNTWFALDMHGQITPGAVTQDYVLRVSIAYRDAAGAAKQCGKDFTANAQWRVVRRKR
jgi:hypothetical protein